MKHFVVGFTSLVVGLMVAFAPLQVMALCAIIAVLLEYEHLQTTVTIKAPKKEDNNG